MPFIKLFKIRIFVTDVNHLSCFVVMWKKPDFFSSQSERQIPNIHQVHYQFHWFSFHHNKVMYNYIKFQCIRFTAWNNTMQVHVHLNVKVLYTEYCKHIIYFACTIFGQKWFLNKMAWIWISIFVKVPILLHVCKAFRDVRYFI